MTPEEARTHYNFLLTLYIQKAESSGPMAFAFVKDQKLSTVGVTPEELCNLFVARRRSLHRGTEALQP